MVFIEENPHSTSYAVREILEPKGFVFDE